MPAVPGLLGHDALRPGARLGRYELLVPIATGGMARVWAARQHGQRGFTKLVAIKTILPNLAREPEFERMFLDEARIASGVHHPNVCEIYELGEEGQILYLAMEWVNGDALVHILRGGQKTKEVTAIDPRIASRIMADAAAGVHAAHNLTDDLGQPLGVVHRDVSPHNVLLTADGNVKVTDFGVAKALGQVHNSTGGGQLRGKLAYMPPEQVAGNFVDRRSDVFALGCVLYEVTTGRPPFVADNDAILMNMVSKCEYPRPTQIAHGYPEELESIVLRAMAKDPVQRFGTAERFRLALEEWLARSGPVVTQSHVAVVVQQRIGPVIERRREKIRTASANPEAYSTAPPAPVSSPSSSGVLPAPPNPLSLAAYQHTPTGADRGPPSTQPPSSQSASGVQPASAPAPIPVLEPKPHTGKSYLVAIGLGIVVALIIGVGAIAFLATRTASAPAKPIATVVKPTTSAAAPVQSAQPQPTVDELPATDSTTTAAPTTSSGRPSTTSTTKRPPALPANPYQ